MWVYLECTPHKSWDMPKLYTVGFYDPKGNWHPDSDYATRDEASERVHYLNGGKLNGKEKHK